jgi:hypothetical protein
MDLSIETKKDDESFEYYDPNYLFVRVLKHVEEETYDFKILDKLPTQIMRVHKKNDKVADFEKRVAELFDIPQEKLLILIRHEHLYNSTVRSELYNMDWRREKSIDDASRLDHG